MILCIRLCTTKQSKGSSISMASKALLILYLYSFLCSFDSFVRLGARNFGRLVDQSQMRVKKEEVDVKPVEIHKSPYDRKKYKLVNLDNGIEVLLISTEDLVDEKSEAKQNAAAAMAVEIGTFSDPEHAGGLAHFLEHMVFMGSEKYPVENEYDSFVSSHGGYCNAFTEGEYTVFQFEIQSEHFAQALDIFAHCFRSPLLSKDSMEREVQAIENEYSLAVNDDENRWQQVLSHHSLPQHVYHKFSWGSYKSLMEEPRNHGMDVHSELRAFYEKHYLPEKMKLVLTGPQPLSLLESNARESFADWRKYSNQPVASSPVHYQPPISPLWRDRVQKIVKVEKGQQLVITWEIPPILSSYHSKSAEYLAHLLGHEAEGSLLYTLKKKGLGSKVAAGVGGSNVESSTMCALFTLHIQLTKKGLKHWAVVVETVYKHLAMLYREGIEDWIFQEIQEISRVSFMFQDEEEPADLAERLSVEMLGIMHRRREELLQASYLHWRFDKGEVRGLLGEWLTVRRGRVDVVASSFGGPKEVAEEEQGDEGGDGDEEEEYEDGEDEEEGVEDEEDEEEEEEYEEDEEEEEEEGEGGDGLGEKYTPLLSALSFEPHVEPHFGVDYWSAPIPPELYEAWESAKEEREESLFPPPRNPYLPSLPTESIGEEKERLDVLPTLQIGYKEGKKRSLVEGKMEKRVVLGYARPSPLYRPKACLYICLSSKASTIEQVVFQDLLLTCWKDGTAEVAYLGDMAGGDVDWGEVHGGAVVLRLGGYSSQLPRLARDLLAKLVGEEDLFEADRLGRCAELLGEKYEKAVCTSSDLSRHVGNVQLVQSSYFATERKKVLDGLVGRDEKFSDRLREWKENMQVRSLAYGNLDKDELINVFEELDFISKNKQEVLSSSQSLQDDHLVQLNILPAATVSIAHATPSSVKESNSAVLCKYLLEQDVMDFVTMRFTLSLLEVLLAEPFFDELRTKQQLGYEVSCYATELQQEMFLQFKVVSSKLSSAELLKRIFQFVTSFMPTYLQSLVEKGELKGKFIPSLLQMLEQPSLSLSDAASSHWERMLDSSYRFERRDEQVAVGKMWLQQKSEKEIGDMILALVREKLLAKPRLWISVASVEESAKATEGIVDIVKEQHKGASIVLVDLK